MRRTRCEECGGVFEKQISDDEANAEALRIWGVPNASRQSHMAVVCDDCFNEIMDRVKPLAAREKP